MIVQRRKDDVVTDVELHALLKKVHPMFRLSKDAMALLIAVSREVMGVIDSVLRSLLPDPAAVVSALQIQQAAKGAACHCAC